MINLWCSSKKVYEKVNTINYPSTRWRKTSQLLCYRMYGTSSVWQHKQVIIRSYAFKWMSGQVMNGISKVNAEMWLNKRNIFTGDKEPRDDQRDSDFLNKSNNDFFGFKNAKNFKHPAGHSPNSTLNNLENLYAAFANQQNQKEKGSDIQSLKSGSSVYFEDVQAMPQSSDGQFASDKDELPLPKDSFTEEFEEYKKKYQQSSSSFEDDSFTEFNPLYPQASDIDVVGVQKMKELQEAGMIASWEELPPNLRPIDREAEWKHFVESQPGLSLSSDESLLSIETASPELRESFERHISQFQERLEAESQLYEEQLIEKHLKEVESHSWILDYLDTSKTQDTAQLKEDMNPFLYNEKYHIGLNSAEILWLKMRPKWKELVEQKRTKVAVAKRDQIESDSSINALFIDTVNMLANNPSCEIHPMDMRNRERAFIARERLQRKLYEIWEKRPVQWMELLNKYLPRSTGIAEKVNNREFWNPKNPWILVAFTRSLIEESDIIKKAFLLSKLDQKIASRMKKELEQKDSLTETPTTNRTPQYGDYHAHRRCLFCGPHRHRFPLEVMNVPLLVRYLNQAGKILGRKVTGLCKKHQKKMTKTIKYARHLNLFTYKKSLFSINNPYLNVKYFGTPTVGYKIYTNPLEYSPKDNKKKQKQEPMPSYEFDMDKPSISSSEAMTSEDLKNREIAILEEVATSYDERMDDATE